MDRHEFSYWIEIKPQGDGVPKDSNYGGIIGCLRGKGILFPDGGLTMDTRDGILYGEVSQDFGAIPEDADIEPAIRETAMSWPGYAFTLLGLDEEDKSVQRRHVYEGGRCVKESHARLIGADGEYDAETVAAIAGWLAENGNAALAQGVRKAFLPSGRGAWR